MTSLSRDQAVQAFLSRYFDDEDQGRVGEIDDYAAEFPGHEDAIRAAFAQLRGEVLEVDDESIEGFEFLRTLGSGGQGLVYLAREIALERLVAVKVLGGTAAGSQSRPWTERMRRRFEREALLASRLQHPGICPIYSMGTHDGRPYLVMPFLAGRTLQEALRDGRLGTDAALRVFEDAARALHFAHEAGIVHRDIKPSNLFLTEEDRVVLLDFGIARESESELELTMTGDLIGTIPFLSPEQVLGRTADRRSDVYSLAVSMYEALTGELPFAAPTQRGLMNAIVHEDAVDPIRLNGSIPRDLGVVIETGLEKEPSRRYQSAAEFADELARVRNKEPILARPAGFFRKTLRFVQRQPKLAASLFTAFAALSLGLAFSLILLSRVQREQKRTLLALEEIDLLTDRTRLEELQAKIPSFEPPRPALLPEMASWLDAAQKLVDRIPLHVEVLEQLQERASAIEDGNTPRSPESERLAAELARLRLSRDYLEKEVVRLEASGEQPQVLVHRKREIGVLDKIQPKFEEALAADRHWVFLEARDRWRHGLQKRLVEELEGFRDGGLRRLSLARVREAHDFASTLRARSLESVKSRWDACIAALRDPERTPRYGGLELAPQIGLVPLGKDPESGLFEFAHLQTGKAATRTEDTGKLEFDEATGIVFVLVPGGVARIGAVRPNAAAPGSGHVDPNAQQFEAPVHEVQLDPFFLSKWEITQAQWIRIVRANPSQGRIGNTFTGFPAVTGLHPVEGLSWDVARDFLDRCGFVFPTSAQWEYAARAGTTTVFATGNEPETLEGHANIADRSWCRMSGRRDRIYAVFDDGWATHSPVGTFAANRFGLHDMHGNVMEFCFDKQHRYSFHVLPGRGLRPIGGDAGRIIRGGSYRQSWARTRCADFVVQRPRLSIGDCGLRPVRPIDD